MDRRVRALIDWLEKTAVALNLKRLNWILFWVLALLVAVVILASLGKMVECYFIWEL
jgi:hypothetical protein